MSAPQQQDHSVDLVSNAIGFGLGLLFVLAAAIFIGSEWIAIDYCRDQGGAYQVHTAECVGDRPPQPLPPLSERQPKMLLLGGVGILLAGYNGWRLRRHGAAKQS